MPLEIQLAFEALGVAGRLRRNLWEALRALSRAALVTLGARAADVWSRHGLDISSSKDTKAVCWHGMPFMLAGTCEHVRAAWLQSHRISLGLLAQPPQLRRLMHYNAPQPHLGRYNLAASVVS